MTAKTIAAHGLDVSVEHEEVPHESGLTIWKITATAGETTHVHTHAVGAEEGARADPPSTDELQSQLDAAREYAAGEAAWKETCRINARSVK
jgi:hypothetical protein